MRLINVRTMQLEEFIGQQVPEYAILSHTWGEGEVSFQDFTSADRLACTRKQGFAKITETCRLAQADDVGYAWVDTCCIDKSSSAELTEAINSMFKWYANSKICYVHLADLEPTNVKPVNDMEWQSLLRGCRWFTRGWTLQELIAPSTVVFYDRYWRIMFNKCDQVAALSSITRITSGVLVHERASEHISEYALAERMSWAAYRQTTRTEDLAYCLMGIFDINMPLLYGEGEKAFQRLQEEIIKRSNDTSLFAWGGGMKDRSFQGLLAACPQDFQTVAGIEIGKSIFNRSSGLDSLLLEESAITNKGLRLKARLLRCKNGGYCMPLHCSTLTSLIEDSPGQVNADPKDLESFSLLSLFLDLSMIGPSTFARTGLRWSPFVSDFDQRLIAKSIYLPHSMSSSFYDQVCGSHIEGFLLRNHQNILRGWSYVFEDISPSDWFDDTRSLMFTCGSKGFTGRARLRISATKPSGTPQTFIIWIAFGSYDTPWEKNSLFSFSTTGIEVAASPEIDTSQALNWHCSTLEFPCNGDVFKVRAEIKDEYLDGVLVHAISIDIC